jgi:hypothetical protein
MKLTTKQITYLIAALGIGIVLVLACLGSILSNKERVDAAAIESELSRMKTPEQRAEKLVWFTITHDSNDIAESERIVEMTFDFQCQKQYIDRMNAYLQSSKGSVLPAEKRADLQSYVADVARYPKLERTK